jgi:hypothetical protein
MIVGNTRPMSKRRVSMRFPFSKQMVALAITAFVLLIC